MSGYLIVNLLGCLLVVTSTLVVLMKKLKPSAYTYAIQSLVLVGIFVTLAVTTNSTELYTWSATAFLTKVILVPGVILFALKKIGEDADKEMPSSLSPIAVVILVIVELIVCFLVVLNIDLPTAAEVKPALAISLAHFFIGLTCITSQRNIMKQIFGYCLMENGSHLTLALLAPSAPALVETGVATDAIFAVIIMVIVAVRIYRTMGTMDAQDLSELKG